VLVCVLLAVLLAGRAWGERQMVTQPIDPVVLTGSDIGFRMAGRAGGSAVGTFVVKVDGRWVSTQPQWDVRRVK
jgi:hypothetical protein